METIGRRRDRLLGLLFLALVALAIALLIAGYGVAVGAGALAGLVLGFLAGTLGVLWLGRGSGRSITLGSMEWSSESGQPTAALMAEMRELGEISSVDIGPSDRSCRCWCAPMREGSRSNLSRSSFTTPAWP